MEVDERACSWLDSGGLLGIFCFVHPICCFEGAPELQIFSLCSIKRFSRVLLLGIRNSKRVN